MLVILFQYHDYFNLLQSLKKTYNHFDMGIYLTALDDCEINIGNPIKL